MVCYVSKDKLDGESPFVCLRKGGSTPRDAAVRADPRERKVCIRDETVAQPVRMATG